MIPGPLGNSSPRVIAGETVDLMMSKVPEERREGITTLLGLAQEMQPAHMAPLETWQRAAEIDREAGTNLYSVFERHYLKETWTHGTNTDYQEALLFLDDRRELIGLPPTWTRKPEVKRPNGPSLKTKAGRFLRSLHLIGDRPD